MARTEMTKSNSKQPNLIKIRSNFLEQLAQFEDKMCDVTLCAKMDGTKSVDILFVT